MIMQAKYTGGFFTDNDCQKIDFTTKLMTGN
jgi:hypothetical protein